MMVTKLKFRVLTLRKQWREEWRAMLVEGDEARRIQNIALQKSGSDALSGW
jgi:hypothetical protein